MSFILDALRKSELERQRQSGPMIAELRVAREDRRLPWALLAIGLLLALNVAVVMFVLLRNGAPPAAPADAAAPPARVVAAPAVAGETTAVPQAVASTLPSAGATAATAAPVPEDGAFVSQAMPGAESLPPPLPDPTLLPTGPAARTSVVRVPAADLPPSIDELPAQATAGLPELSIDLHIYSDDPARRAVFINGRRYQEGSVLAEGPTVEDITRDGAVLRHQGRRFLLPRL